MKKILAALIVAVAAGGMACAANGPTAPSPTVGTKDAALQMTQAEGKISGTYTHEADTLSFEISTQAENVYAVTVKTRGLTLDATIDSAHGASSFDGFATDNGADTQLTKADQPVLVAFNKALDGSLGDLKGNKVADVLSRTASNWSEWPTTVKLSRRILGEEGRSYNSYCGAMGWSAYGPSTYTTHDCCTHWFDPCSTHNRGSSGSTVYAYIGDYGPSSTLVWNNGWQNQGVDHWNTPSEYGDCFGRCGADCGGGHAYTQDCSDHDNCVRNGHWIGSPYCDDEFSSTLDDAMYAPNCY